MSLAHPHHHGDSFTVAHKVHISLPAISLHNLSGGAGVVHCMSRHKILTVWRPGQTQDVGRPTALRVRQKEKNPLNCDDKIKSKPKSISGNTQCIQWVPIKARVSVSVPHWKVWWCLHPSASPPSATLSDCGRQPGRRCISPLDPMWGLSPGQCVLAE